MARIRSAAPGLPPHANPSTASRRAGALLVISRLLTGTVAFAICCALLAPWEYPAAAAAAEDTPTKFCYPVNQYDLDGDGYADLRGLAADDQQFAVRAEDCGEDAVAREGDCDDARSSMHPGRGEIRFNGLDDNCNDKTDEPTFWYSATGNQNTTSSFRMTVYLNDAATVRSAADNNNLYVRIKYARLSDSNNPITLPITRVLSYGGDFTALLTLWNLQPGTVYRTYVIFYKKTGPSTYQRLGDNSNWYHTMTDSTVTKTHKRALMVLRGLKEYDDSNNEIVGYRGTIPDGTRYDADEGEEWCSEFYAWVTRPWLTGVAGITSVEGLVSLFTDAGGYYPAADIPTRAAPGDYIPIDTGERGAADHSGMFLAYDASQTVGGAEPPRVWTLEGNHHNKVKVEVRPFDYATTWTVVNNGLGQWIEMDYPQLTGLGYILTSQLQ